MKRALIIGAAGFVGPYLIHELKEHDYKVFATRLPQENLDTAEAEVVELDILDMYATKNCFEHCKPDVVFHLAAQSSVKLSWEQPDLTVDVNIKGAVHVFEAARLYSDSIRLLLVGSAEEYGIRQSLLKVTEDLPVEPSNYYAVTKHAQEEIGFMLARAYHMDVIATRSFNHIGPGQSPVFVASDFCKQVAEVELGLREPVIYVGNLMAFRDFSDVRDIVRAYRLLAELGKSGQVYNVGSGKAVSIQCILDEILSFSEQDIRIEHVQSRMRPVDVPKIEADISKLERDTDWQPRYHLKDTLYETLQYWRNRLKDQNG